MKAGDLVDDRFRIERLAGSGGMGVVYRATDEALGGSVALKVLGPDVADDGRFLREAQLLSALHHPGIVRHVAHGHTHTGQPYLAMEWLDGEDLAGRLARERLRVEDAYSLGRSVAAALSAAHAHGIVHRDVKPHNIFLEGRDIQRAKILDFGVARGGGALAVTEPGAILGTIAYMAPEQARGERDVDARADLFALGCVLFECLAGRPPFPGAHAIAILAKILMEEAPSIHDFRPDVPAPMASLLGRMLSKRAVDRPASASAVLAELTDLESRTTSPGHRATARPQALTGGEQRVVSVILVGAEPADTDNALAATLISQGDGSLLERLRAAAAPFATRIEPLVDGSVVALVTPHGAATDQVARAARGALAMRGVAPLAPIVVATGHGVIEGRLPIGEVIDRAVTVLRRGQKPSRHDEVRIHVDAVTAGLLDERFEVVSVGGHHELLGLRDPSAERVRTLMGVPTPCVGRERELATLDGILDGCIADSMARVILVTGPPGIGKSRVRYELLRRARLRPEPLEVWLVRGDPVASTTPNALLAGVLRTAVGVLDGEPVESAREKLRQRVERGDDLERARRITPFLGELMGTPFPGEGDVILRAARSDPTLLHDEMMSAFRDFLARECAAHPVLLVLEDLHWADAASVAAINVALRELGEVPLMVLALARPEVHDTFPRLWAERGGQEIALGELPRRAAERLARELLGEAATPDTVGKIALLAAGNAFYLEELIRAAADGKHLELPETVLAMIEARLARLHADERRVLRAASVLGEVFWVGAVESLIGPEQASAMGETPRPARQAIKAEPSRPAFRPAGVSAVLEALAGRELVSRLPRSRLANEIEYRFRHATVRDAAYAMLLDEDRPLGHRLAAEWLERIGGGDPIVLAQSAQHHGLAAEHLVRLGRRSEAAASFVVAARQYAAAGQLEAAIASMLSALEHALSDPTRAEDVVAWLDLLSPWVSACRIAPGLSPLVRPIADHLDAHGTEDDRARARVALASALGAVNLFSSACAMLDEAVDTAVGEPDLLRRTLVADMEISGRQGNIRRGLRAAEALEGLGLPEDPRVLTALASLYTSGGQSERALDAIARAAALSAPDDVAVVGQKNVRGLVHLGAGDYSAALRVLSEAVELGRSLRLRYNVANSLHNMGDAELRIGDRSASRRSLTESLALAEACGQRSLIELNRAFLALLDGMDGAPGADASLKGFIAFAEQREDLTSSVQGELLLMSLFEHTGDRARAREHGQEALDAARRIGHVVFEAEAMATLARLGRDLPSSE